MKEEGWRTQTLGRREKEYGDDADAYADADNKKCNSRMRLSHHPSSRIFRVSRASGGKDRHSKVYTSKGLRDRRIRLSASTAIQFYDLQDRLGYDQPSKAIEWLIKAAASAIAELPSLEYTFSEKPLPIEGGEGGEVEPSSTSETSKSSVLSLSRTAIRVKEKDEDHHNNNVEQVSFTKLLTRGGGGTSSSNGDYLYSSQLEMQQFALFQEHSCYSISPPTLSGFHSGGTLQSNSPSHHHHHHEGRNHQEPFFFSAVADSGAASPTENPSYSAGLQICQGYEQLELKGKGKS